MANSSDNQTFFSLGSEFNDTNLPSTSRIRDEGEDEDASMLTVGNLEEDENSGDDTIEGEEGFDGLQTNAQLLQELNAMVTNEKLAPDLLPCQPEKIDAILEMVKSQKDKIKKITDGHASNAGANRRSNFRGSSNDESINSTISAILSMEVSRIEYLIKCYFRSRLYKIEKYAVHYNHILEKICERAQGDEDNLTEEQKNFYNRFDEDEGKFLTDAARSDMQLHLNQIAKHIPEELDWRTEEYIAKKWPAPNERAYVFARVTRKSGDNVANEDLEIVDPTTEETKLEPARPGDVHLLPFDSVRKRLDDDIILM